MGNDNQGVGIDRPTGEGSRRPIIERLTSGTELRVSDHAVANGQPAVICETQGAMSEQGSEAAYGYESVPQKLVQLVGCRDPKARASRSNH